MFPPEYILHRSVIKISYKITMSENKCLNAWNGTITCMYFILNHTKMHYDHNITFFMTQNKQITSKVTSKVSVFVSTVRTNCIAVDLDLF